MALGAAGKFFFTSQSVASTTIMEGSFATRQHSHQSSMMLHWANRIYCEANRPTLVGSIAL